MSITRRNFMKYVGSAMAYVSVSSLLSGCGGSNQSGDFPVTVFSDVHFNPLYDPSLFNALVAADSGDWSKVFQSSRITSLPARGSDTNYPLFALTLSGIKQNLGASQFVIFTGDILGHGIPQMFYPHYYGNLGMTVPTSPDATAVAAMKTFTDKTVSFFMDQVRSAVGNVPVLFAVGNCDSYSGYGPNVLDASMSPDNSFLVNTAELFYTKFLNGSVDHQGFLSTFTTGGYYSAEPAGTSLMVISLNTILFCQLFSTGPNANDSMVTAELNWLDSRLAAAAAKGKKVWLLMHAPPGADIGTTAKPSNVDSSGHIATASMMWWPEYQAKFLTILAKYPELISFTLAGHTHMDEYRILPVSGAVQITPSISPWFGNNPAYKVFTLSRNTLKPTDYSALNYDLATVPVQFNNYYTFSNAYSSHGLLDTSLAQLTPALVVNQDKQTLYRMHYYSGNNSTTPVTYPYGNPYSPITNVTWPIYWSGITKMEPQEIVKSVNTY